MTSRGSSGSIDASVLLEPGCNLACPVCDCRLSPAPRGSDGFPKELCRGGSVLELRGEASVQKNLPAAIEKARESGFSSIRVRTNGVAFASAARAANLRASGVDGVTFFLASERANVHDAIARVRGAHAQGLKGLSFLAAEGLSIALEIPVLDPSLQNLRATIELARSVAPSITALRLYSPVALRAADGKAPRELLPPRWDRVRPALREAVRFAQEQGLSLSLSERDGIPLCALADEQGALPENAFADRGGRPVPRRDASSLGSACATCPAASVCPGTTRLYLDNHQDRGLLPFASFPKNLRKTSTRWDDERKNAARSAFFVVLRPTVHCNQDCWFCSANETSKNVEEDPGRMMRRIARLARTGAKQVSFSGGEPALSKHLVDYVHVARRSGIDRVELVTNAVLLDKPEKAEALVRAGVTHLFVSLHAHDESLSRQGTRKAGDHARTVRALHHFARHDHLRIDVNHVVSAHNYRSLVRFVEWMHEEFSARIGISFAWVTPQYKALEHVGTLIPRYTDAIPYLKRAVLRAVELGIDVIVGSRQGVPPCLLEEVLPFSDVLSAVSGALSEDKPQKQKAPACASCRLDLVCTGVWKPYGKLFGTDEVRPLPGEKITPEDATRQAERVRFDPEGAYPPALRFGDGRLPRSADIRLPVAPASKPARVRLPVLANEPDASPNVSQKAQRFALIGTGPRAMALARAIHSLEDASLVAIASPHAPEKELPEIDPSVLRVRDVSSLPVDIDAVVIASSTATHAELARLSLSRGFSVLVEKPVASSVAEAQSLADLAASTPGKLWVAYQLRAAGGVEELVGEMGDRKGDLLPVEIAITRRSSSSSPSALQTWARAPLYEQLLHLGDLALYLAGGALSVRKVSAQGGGKPERVSLRLALERSSTPNISIDIHQDAPDDALFVEVRLAGGRRLVFSREGRRDELRVLDEYGGRTRSVPSGGDLERLLRHFRGSIESLASGVSPLASARDGALSMQLSVDMLRALEDAGAPFDRPNEPKRVASFALRQRFG